MLGDVVHAGDEAEVVAHAHRGDPEVGPALLAVGSFDAQGHERGPAVVEGILDGVGGAVDVVGMEEIEPAAPEQQFGADAEDLGHGGVDVVHPHAAVRAEDTDR
ncbi:MAG: hypothetical protein R2749_27175 [Acidimicrobiales bacterium]